MAEPQTGWDALTAGVEPSAKQPGGWDALFTRETPGQRDLEEMERIGRRAGRTREEHEAYMVEKGFSPEAAKSLGQQYALGQAREAERAKVPVALSQDLSLENLAKTGAAVSEQFFRNSIPFSDLMIGQTAIGKNTRAAQEAQKRFAEGKATPDDIKLIAKEERLSNEDAEMGKTLGGKIVQVTGSAPKILGEFAAGSAALQAGGRALGLGRAAAPVSLTGTFSPTAARAALAEPTLGRVVLNHAGRMAMLTPIVPSMWVEEMQQRNSAQGKDANDLSNAPPSLAHAYANMLVLGSMQKNFGLQGAAAKKAAVKGGIFAAEQATADSLWKLADRTVRGADQFNTKYGTFEHLMKGDLGEAAQEATVHAFTGALFAGLHEVGGKPPEGKPGGAFGAAEGKRVELARAEQEARIEKVMGETLGAFGKDMNALKSSGLSAEAAGKRMLALQEQIREAFANAATPEAGRKAAAQVIRDARDAVTDPALARRLAPTRQERIRREVMDESVEKSPDRLARMESALGKAEELSREAPELTIADAVRRMTIPGTNRRSSLAERIADVIERAEKAKQTKAGTPLPVRMADAMERAEKFRGEKPPEEPPPPAAEAAPKPPPKPPKPPEIRAEPQKPVAEPAPPRPVERPIAPSSPESLPAARAAEPSVPTKNGEIAQPAARPEPAPAKTAPQRTTNRPRTELTPRMARDQWASMDSADRQSLPREMRDLLFSAMKKGGIDPKRVKFAGEGREQKPDEAPIDPALEAQVDASDLSPTRKAAVKEMLGGGSTRAAAKRAGVSHEQVRQDAIKVLGEEPIKAVEEAGVQRALERKEAMEAKANIESFTGQGRTAGGGKRTPNSNDLKKFTEEGGFLDLAVLGKLADRVSGWARKWLTSAGNLGKDVANANVSRVGKIARHAQDVTNATKDLEKALGENGVRYSTAPAELLRQMKAALEGDARAMAGLPENVQTALGAMRQHVDLLSAGLKEARVVDGDLTATFDANTGVYLTRLYRVFTDPKWAKKLNTPEGEAIKNSFKSWMAGEILRDQKRVADPAELEGIMRKLLTDGTAAESPVAFISKSGLGSKDIGILKKRGEIPAPLRALWGELEGPIESYAATVGKQSNLLYNHLFLSEVARIGAGKFLFESNQLGEFVKNHPESNPVTLATEGSEAFGPLAGKVTTPEFKQALTEAFGSEVSGRVGRFYMKALGAAKIAKTVMSPLTWVRQFIGNNLLLFGRGHFSASEWTKAVKAMRDNTPEGREYYQELLEQGIAGDSVHSGEFKAIMNDALARRENAAGDALEYTSQKMLARVAGKTADAAGRGYNAMDTFVKIVAYEKEKKNYRDIYPEWSEAQVRAKAAEVVRMQYPSHSQVSKGVKQFRYLPVGSFVTFPAEMVRTTFQTGKLALAEMRDPRTRALGAKRMAYLLRFFGIGAGLAAASRMLSGTDWDEEKAARRFLPEWSKNDQLLHYGRDKNGDPLVAPMGAIDPMAYLIEPFQAALLSGGSAGERAQGVFDATTKPFLGEQVGIRPLLDVARTEERSGKPVYNPEDTIFSPWNPSPGKETDIAKHIGKAFMPSIFPQARELYMSAAGDKEQKTGKEYPIDRTLLKFGTGQAIQPVEIGKTLGFKGRDFEKRMRNAEKLYGDLEKAKGDVSQPDKDVAYAKSEQQRRAVFEDFRQDVMAAQKLGKSQEEVRTILKESGLSREEISQLIEGRYVANQRK